MFRAAISFSFVLSLAPALGAQPKTSATAQPPANAAKPPPAGAPTAAPAAASAVKPAAVPANASTNTPPALDKSGVVTVEEAGRVVALGVVLNGDGRIVTALSALAPGQLFVRYANGNLENARIGHTDASRDLALLVPKTARFQSGIKASDSMLPPTSAKLTGFTLAANRTLQPTEQTLQGLSELGGHPVLKLEKAPKPNELGGPLLDAHGTASAIIVRGCPSATPPTPCTVPAVALPVGEIREFLRSRPPTAGFQLPRLGIVGRASDNGVVRGVSITTIEAQSPAAALGLNANADPNAADILVAFAGTPVTTEDALRAELARHSAGERVELLVFGKGAYRTLTVRLGAPPAEAAANNKPAPLPAPNKPNAKPTQK